MNDSISPGMREFHTTRWSLVAAAKQAGDPAAARPALAALCRDYWYPLYAFVRMTGHSPHDAQDLTQAFFADLLERDGFAVPPGKGKFRSYLLGALKHFLANDWHRGRAQKRGGGQALVDWDALEAEERLSLEPPDCRDPAVLFDRRWAMEILQRAIAALRAEFSAEGREESFETLKGAIIGAGFDAEAAAAALRLSPGALKTAVHRLRRRYREIIRAEIADTVSDPAEIDGEMRHLVAVLRDPASHG